MKALQYLNKYFFKYKYRLLAGILITVLSKFLALEIPTIIRNSFNVIEDYEKGLITDIEVVKHKLLLNILLIIILK